jgi:putative transcriptional regulator
MLLIARRGMPDPRFRQTVVFLAAHDKGGSLGLIVNRASTATLGNLLPEVDDLDKQGHQVYFGGPVDIERLKFLVRNDDEPEDAVHIMDDLYISGSQKTLKEMLERDKTQNEFRIYLGYAGWGPDQLTSELDRDDWHLHKAKMEDIFNTGPDTMWENLIDIYDPKGQLVDRQQPTETLLADQSL